MRGDWEQVADGRSLSSQDDKALGGGGGAGGVLGQTKGVSRSRAGESKDSLQFS